MLRVVLVLGGLAAGAAGAGGAGGAGRAPALPWRARRDVSTAQGAVRGYLGPRHFAFLGIPYARPPTLSDRFKAPEAPPEWDGIFEATYRVKCLQSSGAGEENCLVINVFVPENVPECCPLPVLVHVHDGGFHDGWGVLHPPTRLLQDFIIVTFNYRLGVLGFLCLGIPEAPGNAGLKDQVAALYWIQQNIASFGGNPNAVTVYGTGSGAVSVQLLLLSGALKGLTHKVIFESGSVLAPSAMTYEPFTTALQVAESLGYEDNGNADELVQFYQSLPLEIVVNISTKFSPCVESGFLYAHSMIDQDPLKMLIDGDFEKIPMMVLYSNFKEMKVIDENLARFTAIPETFDDLLPNNLEFESDKSRYRIADMVLDFYFENRETMEVYKIIDSYKDYINDVFMEYPVYRFSTLYATLTSVPVYVMRLDTENEEVDVGSYDDAFKYIYVKEGIRDGYISVLERLISLFSNFIKIGDPTPLTSELIPIQWEPFNPQGADVVEIDRPGLQFSQALTMAQPPASERLRFWDQIYSKYTKKHIFDRE